MPKLEAIVNMPFGVGVKNAGELFDATDEEAKLLVALKRAKRVDAGKAAKSETTAQDAAPAEATSKSDAKPNRGYSRRDMKAK